MTNNKLILRRLTSPWTYPTSDITKSSVLTHDDVDNNFIYLKGELIYSARTAGTNLILDKINSSTVTVDLSSLITAGDTFVSGATIQTGITGDTLVLTRTDGGIVTTSLVGVSGAFTHTASGVITPTNAYGNIITGGAFNNYSSILGGKNNTMTPSGYAGYGSNSIVGGQGNNISGSIGYNSIIGGYFNSIDTTYGYFNLIGSGQGNKISGGTYMSSIINGKSNNIDGEFSSIVNGFNNNITNNYGVIGGGFDNIVISSGGVIGGGNNNNISGISSVIAGGVNNIVSGSRSVIAGGLNNYVAVAVVNGVIAGGSNNILAGGGFIGGGTTNTIENGTSGNIVGGNSNLIGGTGNHNAIGGGESNIISGSTSTFRNVIAGGSQNIITNCVASTIVTGSQNDITNSDYSFISSNKSEILNANNSAIIGGAQNTITHNNAILLGGSVNVSISANTTHVEKLNIKTLNGTAINVGLGLDVNGMVVSGDTSATFTGNTSGDCITDIFVSNIHSCSPLNINPLDEGDVFFGGNGALTLKINTTGATGSWLGINTTVPNYPLHVLGNAQFSNGSVAIGESPDPLHKLRVTTSDSDGINMSGFRVDMSHQAVKAVGNGMANFSGIQVRSVPDKTSTGRTQQWGIQSNMTSAVSTTGNHLVIAGRFVAKSANADNYAIQIEDGNEAAGRVLVCQPTSLYGQLGLARWEDASSLSGVGSTNKYAASITFTGGTPQTITHNLGSEDVQVQLKDSTGARTIEDVTDTYTSNTLDITVSITGTYRVIIIG